MIEEPQHTVTRQWLLDMLASVEAEDYESCRDILRAALKLVEGDWPDDEE